MYLQGLRRHDGWPLIGRRSCWPGELIDMFRQRPTDDLAHTPRLHVFLQEFHHVLIGVLIEIEAIVPEHGDYSCFAPSARSGRYSRNARQLPRSSSTAVLCKTTQ